MAAKPTIKNVKIVPGCVSCGSCHMIAPDIFEIKQVAQVKKNAPIAQNEDKIIEAALMCPVSAIEIEFIDQEEEIKKVG
ncbi:MAG: ferredoxin [bacterium]